jgi:tetratricopeptide (TPR) repeat protein
MKRVLGVMVACALGCSTQVAKETTVEKLPPPNAEAVRLFVSGADELKAGQARRLPRAKELLEKAVAQAPGLWEAQYDLGLVYRRLGDLTNARKQFLKARELAADAPEPVLALAECELSMGNLSTSAGLLEDFLRKDAGHTDARLALAAVQRERGDLDGALRAARDVLVKNPSETRALLEVGRVYRAQGELEVAELVLEKARVIDEKNAAVHNELGLLALERGDTQLAFTHFAHAREMDAKYLPAHINQGSVLLNAGDFDAAEHAYRAALQVEASSVDANIGLAIALRGRGKHREAKQLYEGVLEGHPGHLAALFDLGVVEADFLDQKKQAIGRFEKFLELAPNNDTHRAAAERYVQDLRMALGSPTP